jgi:hypothetical protein
MNRFVLFTKASSNHRYRFGRSCGIDYQYRVRRRQLHAKILIAQQTEQVRYRSLGSRPDSSRVLQIWARNPDGESFLRHSTSWGTTFAAPGPKLPIALIALLRFLPSVGASRSSSVPAFCVGTDSALLDHPCDRSALVHSQQSSVRTSLGLDQASGFMIRPMRV